MSSKTIMVCLDGSKNSLRGLDAAILFAKQSNTKIIGVHSDTSFSAFSAVHVPILPEEKWTSDVRRLIQAAERKVEKKIELTVMAKRQKLKGVKKLFSLGSVSRKVVENINCPVVLIDIENL